MTLDELCKKVEEGQGVITIPMSRLRNMVGAGKLGVHVLEKIAAWLRSRGLRFRPRPLPDSSDSYVRIYDPETDVGSFIAAVLDTQPESDGRLRELAGGRAIQTIERIRELLSESTESAD